MNALVGAGFLQAYGVYVVAWQAAWGWSATVLAAAFALQRAAAAVVSPLVGAWLRRFGPRRVALAGVLSFGSCVAALGAVRHPAALFALMPLLGVATTAMGPLTQTAALVARFARRRATAVSWTLTGMGLGGALVPVVAQAIVHWGMAGALPAVGLVVVVTGGPAALALAGRASSDRVAAAPAPVSAAPAAPSPGSLSPGSLSRGSLSPNTLAPVAPTRPRAAPAAPARRLPWPEGGGRAFWTLVTGHVLAASVVGSLMVHLVAFLRAAHGLDLGRASALVAVLSVSSIAGQVAGGAWADRRGHRGVAVGGAVAESVGLLGLAWAGGGALGWTLVTGLGWGLRAPQMFVLRAEHFGHEAFPTVMGWSMAFATTGLVVGPVATARLMGGPLGPRGAFMVLAGVAALAALAFASAPPPPAHRPPAHAPPPHRPPAPRADPAA